MDHESRSKHLPMRVRVIAHSDLIAAGVAAITQENPQQIVLVSEACPPRATDLVLLDGSHPATVLSDIADLIASGHRRVVVFDWDADPATMTRARAAGATGFVSKALAARDLLRAVRAACDADAALGPTAAPSVRGSRPAADPWRPSELTEREAEVLNLICCGSTNLDIAAELFLSVNTVKTYIRTTYRKIAVTRRTQAVLWAFENGLVHPDPQPRSGDGLTNPTDEPGRAVDALRLAHLHAAG